MSFFFQCPYCSTKLEIRDDYNGSEIVCQNCGWRGTVPRPVTSGARPGGAPAQNPAVVPSDKSLTAYILLGIFLGSLGIHDFYAGYTTNGIIKLLITFLTCSFGGVISAIWAIVDVCTVRKDANGRPFVS